MTAPLAAVPIAEIPCKGCGERLPQTAYGERADGQVHVRCPNCRRASATRASHAAWRPETPPDEKALRVVERWCGFPYREWHLPPARAWALKRGVWLEDVWTHRMMTLRDRRARAAERAQTTTNKKEAAA